MWKMAFEEVAMRECIDSMDKSIHNIINRSPLVDYNDLCETFAKFCDNFNSFIGENEDAD